MRIVSVVLGATAGWAAYFAWEFRESVGGQEVLAGLIGALVGFAVWQIFGKRD
jgi:uncharacterized membrane protein YeaQ/YmgE (transglycosylase-associated protein family)